MKTVLLALGLFVLGFGGIAAFSGGLPMPLFDVSNISGPRDDISEEQLVTLADYGTAAEKAYDQMLTACSREDRKAYGRAMNALVVAKRHANSGKIERGNIAGRDDKLMVQFLDAVRKGAITRDHVPFGSLRSVIASVSKDSASDAAQQASMSFALRGRIEEAGEVEHNDCALL